MFSNGAKEEEMGKYARNPYGLCKMCNVRPANQFHHKFSQTVQNCKHYGKYIHAEFNLVDSCPRCNVSHANIPPEYKWTEIEFREELALHYPEILMKINPMKSCKKIS